MKPKLVWSNTFNAHLRSCALEEMAPIARMCGYPYIAHGGKVFDASTLKLLGSTRDLAKEALCYRISCGRPGATWFNKSTRQLYCVSCAAKINHQPGQEGLCVPEDSPEARQGS